MKKILEVMGMVCPFPLVEAKEAIKGLNSGDELEVQFDCTQGTESIPTTAHSALTSYRRTKRSLSFAKAECAVVGHVNSCRNKDLSV